VRAWLTGLPWRLLRPRYIIPSIILLFAALAVIVFFLLPEWMVDGEDFPLRPRG
jgi:hypothetical protein